MAIGNRICHDFSIMIDKMKGTPSQHTMLPVIICIPCLAKRRCRGYQHARRNPVSPFQDMHHAYAVLMIMFTPPVSVHWLHSNSRLSLTHFRTRFLNSGVLSLHKLAASTFAGDSSFGLDNMEMTERRMVSGVWTGDQRSAADS